MTSIPYRRKREGRTNYKKRLALLKSGKHRLVVRRSNTQFIAQLVKYEPSGDVVVCGVQSSELLKKGWKYSCKSVPAAYLTGRLLASKLAKFKEQVVLDLGLHTPSKGGRLYALVKGVVDGGVSIACSEEVFPDEKRWKGLHIEQYITKAPKGVFNKYDGADKFRKSFDTLLSKI